MKFSHSKVVGSIIRFNPSGKIDAVGETVCGENPTGNVSAQSDLAEEQNRYILRQL